MAAKKRTKKELEQLKDHAKLLITREGLTQKEAALRTDISATTINKWYAEGKWDKLQKNILLTRPEQLANLYEELEELNEVIKKREAGKRFADSKEADARRKLLKDIETLEKEASIPEVIHVCSGLLDFVRKVDLKKAQELSKYIDGFVKSKL
jgi:transposase